MPKYIFEGFEYTLEEIQEAASAKNMSVDEYLAANPNIQVIEDAVPEPNVQEQEEFEDPFLQSVKKIIGPVEEAAAVGPEVTAEQPDTDLVSEDISLDSPDPGKDLIKVIKSDTEFITFINPFLTYISIKKS